MWFAPDSVWNKALPADVPIDPMSSQIVTELVRRANVGGGFSINFRDFTTPVFIAAADDPLLTWTLDNKPGTIPQPLIDAFSAVPTPAEARPSHPWELPNQGDNHIVIYQPSTDKMWEAWKGSQFEVDGAHPKPDPTTKPPTKGQAYAPQGTLEKPGWHWEYGAAMDHVSTNKGIFDNTAWLGKYGLGWHATATGLPLVAGLITHDEGLAAKEGVVGAIPHALALAAPQPLYFEPRWPATDSDGSSHEPNAPGEGMIFKLKASFDLSTIADNFMREVCRAAQRFGIIMRDGGAAVVLYCESRATVPNSQAYADDIWAGPGWVKGTKPNGVFTDYPINLAPMLPWSQLEVVRADYRPTAPVPSRLIVGV